MTNAQYKRIYDTLKNINEVEKGRLQSSHLFQLFMNTERKDLDKMIFNFDLDIIIQGLNFYTEKNKTFTNK